MTPTYSASRTIEAPPERVWALLVDADGYPSWNPAVVSVDGRIAPGEKIKLTSTLNPRRAFTLHVAESDEPRRMVWTSGMPLGLFRGTRTYTLEPAESGRTEFSMQERFTGPLAPLITKSIPDMTESFEQFAEGLKKAAEG